MLASEQQSDIHRMPIIDLTKCTKIFLERLGPSGTIVKDQHTLGGSVPRQYWPVTIFSSASRLFSSLWRALRCLEKDPIDNIVSLGAWKIQSDNLDETAIAPNVEFDTIAALSKA